MKKPLKIALIVLAVLIALALLLGSCNYNEEAVDNSSSTSTQTNLNETITTVNEQPTFEQETKLFSVYTNSLGNPHYDAIVEIRNTGNVPLYLGAGSFDIEDANGHLVATDDLWVSSCPDIINAGEVGYYYTSTSGDLPDGTDTNMQYVLVPHFKIEKATGSSTDYLVSDTALNPGAFGPEITGRVQNTTDQDDSLVYVQAIYYDANGNVLGITGTNISDLTAGSQQSFSISGIMLPNNVSVDQIANFKVIARKSYMQF